MIFSVEELGVFPGKNNRELTVRAIINKTDGSLESLEVWVGARKLTTCTSKDYDETNRLHVNAWIVFTAIFEGSEQFRKQFKHVEFPPDYRLISGKTKQEMGESRIN